MSPAVGPTDQQGECGEPPMPPTPPSNHSELGNGPSAMAAQTAPTGYPPQPPMGPPPHMMYNSKMAPSAGAGPPPTGPGGQQPMPPYGSQHVPNYGHYPPRPAYGPGPGGNPGAYGRPNAIPPSYPGYPQQYPGGGWNNASGPAPSHHHQQQFGMMPIGGKGGPPPPPGAPSPQRHPGPPPPQAQGQYPPRPQGHSQMMKGGYPPPSGGPTPPPNSFNGPPIYNGPGMAPPNSAPPMYNGPGMPPPPPNNTPGMGLPPHQPQGYPSGYPNAHQINNYGGQSPSLNPPPSQSAAPTGPDGVPLHDESSQQSTLSQSSDRSDGRQTPKTGPSFATPGYPPASSPHSSAPSPGGSLGSSAGGHDSGYPRDIASPNWHRTQTSPHPMTQMNCHGFNNSAAVGAPPLAISPGTPQSSGPYMSQTDATLTPTGRISKASTKNSETLTRLYEMDDNPDRRMFLDKLLSFMEEKGTPIVQCPTISKNPLDLYKLYIFAKEKGGYLECTKNKTWKDIAAQLGIGASSSGAYTLKKHYGKNLLPFECFFDRGGMDPGPILAHVESQTKKKSKGASSHPPPAPSPGSQDSRDSYSNSSDMYSSFPPGAAPPPPPPPPTHNSFPPTSSSTTPPGAGPSADRPPSHPGSQPHHSSTRESVRLGNPFEDAVNLAGSTHGGYPPTSGYGYPPGGPPPAGYPPSSYPSGPRPGWPSHSGYMGGPPPPPQQGTAQPQPATSAPGEMYARPPWPQPPVGYGARPPYSGSQPGPPTTVATTTPQGPPYGGQTPYPDQYQGYSSNSAPVVGPSTPYNNSGAPGKTPPAPPTQSPRANGPPGPYPYPGQRPPMYPGGQPQWPNRYPAPGYGPPSGDRPWPPPTAGPQGPPPPGPGPAGQWSGDRPMYYGSSGSGAPPGPWGSSKSAMRPPYRPDLRGPVPMGPQRPSFPGNRYREMSFPPGSVEATPPYLMKRRRYTKLEVQPVEGWRLVMALKSGLLMESTWALDVINIMLYDDNGIVYFGLGNMPGLFEALLEHWRASLIAMFGITQDLEIRIPVTRALKRPLSSTSEPVCEPVDKNDNDDDADSEIDLGIVRGIDSSDKRVVLTHTEENFTKRPRFVDEDVLVDPKDDELFITDNERDWDNANLNYDIGQWHWLNGGGNTTEHIVTHLEADMGKNSFVRYLKDVKFNQTDKSKETEIIDNSEKSVKNEVISVENSVEDQSVKLEHVNGDIGDIKEECEDSVEEIDEDIIDRIHRMTGIVLRDPEVARKRWHQENLEEENHLRDEPSLHLISETNDNLGRRAACISTIMRNLSFVPGNEYDMSKNSGFLAILGKLLLLHHWYPRRPTKQRNYDRGEEEDSAESCASLSTDDEWWWEYLHLIRENVMVILTNIAGALDLEPLSEDISRPIIEGLLEWAVSSSAYAQDPFPNVGPTSQVSPQRCAIEALCKLCLLESNVDLILTAPLFWRLEKLTKMLAKKLYRYEDQVLREFSINMLYYLSAADTGVARMIAMADTTVSLLLSFIEQAEQNAMVIAQQHGINALRDNPDSMGTSLDMLRRAATTLSNLSRHKDNITLIARQEQRLLSLVMSQILDQGVAAILSSVLFNIGANAPPPPTAPSIPATPPPPSESDVAQEAES